MIIIITKIIIIIIIIKLILALGIFLCQYKYYSFHLDLWGKSF